MQCAVGMRQNYFIVHLNFEPVCTVDIVCFQRNTSVPAAVPSFNFSTSSAALFSLQYSVLNLIWFWIIVQYLHAAAMSMIYRINAVLASGFQKREVKDLFLVKVWIFLRSCLAGRRGNCPQLANPTIIFVFFCFADVSFANLWRNITVVPTTDTKWSSDYYLV